MQHRDDESRPETEPRPAPDATSTDAPDADVVRRERSLPCSTRDAWALLRDADGLSRWLADEVDLVVAPGEEGTFRDGEDELAVLVESVDEGRRLSLRWWSGDGEPSVVDLTLDRIDEAHTRLTVTEIPLRLIAAPDHVPARWTMPGDGRTAAGPQALALVCR